MLPLEWGPFSHISRTTLFVTPREIRGGPSPLKNFVFPIPTVILSFWFVALKMSRSCNNYLFAWL